MSQNLLTKYGGTKQTKGEITAVTLSSQFIMDCSFTAVKTKMIRSLLGETNNDGKRCLENTKRLQGIQVEPMSKARIQNKRD